jgi:hypothetical protein
MGKCFKWALFMLVLTILAFGVSATLTAAATPTPHVTPTAWRTATPRDPIFYENDTWEVVTGYAYNITATSATIDGTIILHPATGLHIGRFDIIMVMQYWEANDPANKITAGTLDSRTGLTTLTVTLTGLKPDTVYMYQAVKTGGPSPYPNGNVRSFQTLPFVATPTPDPTAGGIKVRLYNPCTAATGNQIRLGIQLINSSTATIPLPDVKIRYYYTIDGAKPQRFYCDCASVGRGNVTGTFVAMAIPKTGADTYVEIGFKEGAGSLAAGGNALIHARFAKNDGTDYTQTNDYSFNFSANRYVDWIKATGYVSGILQWGIEP